MNKPMLDCSESETS